MKNILGKNLSLLFIGVAAIVGIAVFTIQLANASRAELPVYQTLPAFETTDHRDRAFTQRDLTGKITVAEFFFTRCPSACPVMNKKMSDLYDLYGKYDKVQFLSITVEPTVDTLETLQRYAEKHGVRDTRWKFVRTDIEKTITLSEKGFLLPAEKLPAAHSTKFILIDPTGTIRGYYQYDDAQAMTRLKEHIRELAKQFPEVRTGTYTGMIQECDK
jgi:protein SCO1